jgi:hypothetical protein
MTDWLKKQIGQQVNDIGYGRATDLITRLGKSLPVTVAAVKSSGIVTVNFEVDASPNTLQQIDVPILYPEYIRYPIQVGDKGLCVPADVRLGPISGIGTSTTAPVLSARPGNLGGLAFLWIGNTDWTEVDPTALVMYCVNQSCVLTLSPAGATISGPSGNLTVEGNLSAGNGITGSFSTPTGQTVMFQNGIITNMF